MTPETNPFNTQQAQAPAPSSVSTAAAPAPAPSPAPVPAPSGLVTNAMGNAQTYTPTARSVGTKNTVQGQVDSILAKDGPLFQRARGMALEQANSRGLINTSMAVEAAQGAVMDRALPMAQQDAQAHNQADADNMNAYNQAGQFNAGEKNQFGRQALDQQFQTSERMGNEQFTAGENAQTREFNMRVQQLQETGLDRRQAESIASNERQQASQQTFTGEQNQLEREATDRRIVTQHQQTLEQLGFQAKLNSANVPATYAANVATMTMDRVNAILADPNLDPAAKRQAVENVITYANTTISLAEQIYGATLPRITSPTGASVGGMDFTPTTAPAAAAAPTVVADRPYSASQGGSAGPGAGVGGSSGVGSSGTSGSGNGGDNGGNSPGDE